jgi:hypothetical protein
MQFVELTVSKAVPMLEWLTNHQNFCEGVPKQLLKGNKFVSL